MWNRVIHEVLGSRPNCPVSPRLVSVRFVSSPNASVRFAKEQCFPFVHAPARAGTAPRRASAHIMNADPADCPGKPVPSVKSRSARLLADPKRAPIRIRSLTSDF
jgi:hypothetical protein